MLGLTHVHEFVEEDLNPPDVTEADFYHRHSVGFFEKDISVCGHSIDRLIRHTKLKYFCEA